MKVSVTANFNIIRMLVELHKVVKSSAWRIVERAELMNKKYVLRAMRGNCCHVESVVMFLSGFDGAPGSQYPFCYFLTMCQIGNIFSDIYTLSNHIRPCSVNLYTKACGSTKV